MLSKNVERLERRLNNASKAENSHFGKSLRQSTPHLSYSEFSWIDYVSKCLHSLWALHDENSRIHSRTRCGVFSPSFNLAKDLENFEPEENFLSVEAKIWNIFRVISSSRVLKNDINLITSIDEAESMEKTPDGIFKFGFKDMLFCAKIECRIGIYDLLSTRTTNEERVGCTSEEMENIITSGFPIILKMVNNSLSNNLNPNHAEFPVNPYLISRVALLIEDRFSYVSKYKQNIYVEKHFDKLKKASHEEREKIRILSTKKLKTASAELEKESIRDHLSLAAAIN